MPCRLMLAVLLAAALPWIVPAAQAQAEPERLQPPVRAELLWPVEQGRPGSALSLAVVVHVGAGYHVNADAGQIKPTKDFAPHPTKVAVIAADPGLAAAAPVYPKAMPFKADYVDEELMSFSGLTVIRLPVKLDEGLAPGSRLKLAAELSYQACAERLCLLPETVRLETDLAVASADEEPKPINQEVFAGQDRVADSAGGVHFGMFGWTFTVDGSSWAGIVLLLATAALGGMLLNFTPCVLPLIPIKIISLSYAAKNRRHCLLLGLFMSLGVLSFWLLLGGMIALVSGFSATNQLFQYPAFTMAVGVVIAVMALGMFDFFSLRLPGFLYMIHPEQDTLPGSFGLGILAAILSTPCTAPFMGAAAAWASAQPPAATLTVFASIGSGMALPYLLLSASPHLVERMPRSGPASLLVKQVMGLLMLAAAAYFVGIGTATLLAEPTNPPSRLYWWPVMSLSLAAGGWLSWRTFQIARGRPLKIFFMGIGALMAVFSAWGATHLAGEGPIQWTHYSPERLRRAFAEGKTVVMVFTAEWCLNCKVLEQTMLDAPRNVEILSRDEVVPMKVDITGSNPPGREMLKKTGSLSIPLLVVFSRAGRQVYKSDFYAADEVHEAIVKALKDP